MAHIIQFYLMHDAQLAQLIRPSIIYATSSPATASLRISRAESKDALRSFSSGDANLLISTSVAEEGLDIPESNCVIYFDRINHAVSYVQGRGRARQDNSSFVVLDQRADRPASVLAEQELEQHDIASSYKPKKSKVKASEKIAQTNRERGAMSILMQDVAEVTAISTLNLYCKKTKALCEENVNTAGSQLQCTLHYRTVLRSETAQASGNNRKQAKRRAAVVLLSNLQASVGK